jgi:hypothetical protein
MNTTTLHERIEFLSETVRASCSISAQPAEKPFTFQIVQLEDQPGGLA